MSTPGRLSARWMLLIGAWAGLAAGLQEAADFSKKRFLEHRLISSMPDDVIWAAPVSDAALAIVAALVLVAVGTVLPSATKPRFVLSLFVSFAMFAPLLWLTSIAPWAALLLAAGVGTQLGRVLAQRWRFTRRLVLTTTPAFAALVVAAAVGLAVHRAQEERTSLQALPPADDDAPNVLLVVLDTVRASRMSLHGAARATTPALERLAAESTVFDNAIAPSSWTLPSHVSIMTGRRYDETGADWKSAMSDEHLTLAEWFGGRGYRTAGVVGNLLYCDRANGLDRGFGHYEDFDMSVGQIVHTSKPLSGLVSAVAALFGRRELLWRSSADDIFERSLDWIDGGGDRPWCLFVNLFDAHSPYLPPQPYRDRFGPTDDLVAYNATYWGYGPTRVGEYSSAERASAVNAYDGSLAYLDAEIERFLGALRTRGLLDDTVVVITSDHGEEFGEHGFVGHGRFLYDDSVHVPLLVRWPGRVPAGRRISPAVSLRDIPATLRQLVAPDEDSPFPGRPLERLWSRSAESAEDVGEPALAQLSVDWVASGESHSCSVVIADHSVLLHRDGAAEVYDRAGDPAQRHDLSETVAGQDLVRRATESLRVAGVTWQH